MVEAEGKVKKGNKKCGERQSMMGHVLANTSNTSAGVIRISARQLWPRRLSRT
jgi:hypothetical protein